MEGAMKYFLKKLLGDEIFRSMVSWATKIFLENLVSPPTYLMYTPLMQLSFFCGIVIDDTPTVVFGGCCNLWFGCCCCTSCFDFQGFLEILASFLNFYSKENWNRSATFFDLSQLCLSYHLSYYLTEILTV